MLNGVTEEVAAIQLLVHMANAAASDSENAVAQLVRGVRSLDLIDREALDGVSGAQWWAWSRNARVWALMAMRTRKGKNLWAPGAKRKALPAYAANDPRGPEAHLDDVLRAEAVKESRREFGRLSRREVDAVMGIGDALEGLRPRYQFDGRRLRVHWDLVPPIAIAAYGAALLFDKTAGTTSQAKGFVSYRSRLSVCGREACGRLVFSPPNRKGPQQLHCPGHANAERQRRYRRKTAS